ncbi:MAG: hypothetical protein ACYCX2_08470 [Christensenellales bacterium]
MEMLQMNKKSNRIACLYMLVLLLLVFAGCSINQNGQSTKSGNEATASIPLLYGVGQTAAGGASKTNVNLKSVAIQEDDEDIIISLSFLYGSKYMGLDEAVMDHVPDYQVTETDAPYRLKIQMEGVIFWDWENEKPDLSKLDAVHGMFRLLPSGTNPYVFYIQLTQEMTYSVEEKNDMLQIALHPVKKTPQKLYYAVASCFYEYQERQMKGDIGMTPVLCQDPQKIVLISAGYPTEAEAKAFANLVMENNRDVVTNNRMTVVQLTQGSPPLYDHAVMADIQRPVIKNSGEDRYMEPLMVGGTFLCASSDGSKMVFARTMVRDGTNTTTELWIAQQSGRKYRMNLPVFASVPMAMFSPDNTILAIMENTGEGQSILLASMDTNELRRLESGEIGKDISSFAWGGDSKVLYVLTGQENRELIEYSIDNPAGKRAVHLIKTGVNSRDLVYQNGLLYYINAMPGTSGAIMKFQPGGDGQQLLSWGSEYSLAPDGSHMAILTYGGKGKLTSILLHDLASGAKEWIETDAVIQDYHWKKDEAKLYYLKSEEEGSKDSVSTLCEYDMMLSVCRDVFKTYAAKFFFTGKPGYLLLSDTVTLSSQVELSYLAEIK